MDSLTTFDSTKEGLLALLSSISVTQSSFLKTAISAKTNRIIGGNPPSIYLARLQRNASISDEYEDEEEAA